MNAPLVTALSERDIFDLLEWRTAERGKQYWRSGRVVSLRCEPDADALAVIRASVRGSARTPYSVVVTLGQDIDSALEIAGDCSCPIGYDCKHVAATLFAAIANAPRQAAFVPLRPGHEANAARSAEPLSAELAAWLELVARIGASDSEEYPPDVRQRLVYVLNVHRFPHAAPRLVVTPLSTRLLKDGSFSRSTRHYNPSSALQGAPAQFLRSSDLKILRGLEELARRVYSGAAYWERRLVGDEGAELLEAMLATGRARWGAFDGPVVARGPERRARPQWRLGDDAALRIDFVVEDAADEETLETVCLAPPWYVDEGRAVLGPLDTGLPPLTAETLYSVPPVPAGQETALGAGLEARVPALAVLKPPALPAPERVTAAPTPHLALTARAPQQAWGAQASASRPIPIASLSFRYGPALVPRTERRRRPTLVSDGRVIEVTRDPEAERAAEERLPALGFVPLPEWDVYGARDQPRGGFMLVPPGEEAWYAFVARELPALRAEGWEIAIAPDFPVRLVHASGPIEARLDEGSEEGSGIDWLELALGVLVDGERVDLVPALIALITGHRLDPALARQPPDEAATSYLPLLDGRTLAIPARRLWSIVAALRELLAAGLDRGAGGTVRFSPLTATDLALAEEATRGEGVAWVGGERLRTLGATLRANDGIAHADVPASFAATLRPYQARGVDWLQLLRSAGLGGVLADDMGLGKTVQTLAHLAIEQASGRMDRPSLIVAPTSVAPVWRAEAARFAPALKVLFLHGADRHERFDEIDAHDVVVSTYPLLARDSDVLAKREWHVVVLDEAQTIKNPNATVSRVAFGLRARHRLCLTGTPIENHLGDLWSLFAFASPGFLGDRREFQQRWRRPIEREGDADRRRLLARRVRPFLLRRTKDEVARELPPRSEIVESVEMTPAQRDLYESVRLAMHQRVRDAIATQGLARSHIIVLDALLKLRQACCDPRLLKLQAAKLSRARSAKLDRLLEMLPELIEDGRRVLLFSQFTSMLALIEEALQAAGLSYVLLTGDTRDREAPVQTFQSGRVPLFLISLKAGGVGLNLTTADTVIHYDPWWNPAVEEQATNRAHRIGQEKPVFVYRLVTRGSIEEKMELLKDRKRELARGIFDADAGSTLDLTERDIEDLFAAG